MKQEFRSTLVHHNGEGGKKLKVFWHQEIEQKYVPSREEAENDRI